MEAMTSRTSPDMMLRRRLRGVEQGLWVWVIAPHGLKVHGWFGERAVHVCVGVCVVFAADPARTKDDAPKHDLVAVRC